MKNSFVLLCGIIIVGVLLSHMFLYQVRYDQVAVRTTFDKADDSSVQETPGLKWRWPWPINKVTLYPRRLQLLEDKIEELQTADGKSVIVRTYLTWRIVDPLKFYVTLKDPAEAARQLSSRLREVRGLVSNHRFDELVNLDRSKLKLDTIEADATRMLDAALEQAGYGIKVESVGIHKIILPESTTDKVFDTMIASRERLAENALQEGQAQASAIRSEAASARDRILAFAERRAQAIRAQGDREASVQYQSFAKNEEFAIFLRKVDALKKMLDHNTTFVLSADSLGILDWFNKDPGQRDPGQRDPGQSTPGRKPLDGRPSAAERPTSIPGRAEPLSAPSSSPALTP